MIQKDRELLLKDLCARLPYGVKIQTWYGEIITSDLNTFPYSTEEMDKEGMWDQLDNFRPYLRPMSSMTIEERKDWYSYSRAQYDCEFHPDPTLSLFESHLSVDWLNENHFDYRGLIPMGLAIEVTEKNNPYTQKI